ncbi:fatty acyl-CoA reductase wat [Drosophila ficusphila]|uniref:fatty acyl-CoA reductase wat n=1 Tax=Drosophila ficusphila TaxID=30025 RepID=UPI0007E8839A|nr:fatty acyl-CoA reductase wat [Drosophila ficusphila]
MASEILSFYKDKTVFVTGGTGMLGKVIIEKLLRSTEVKRIYFLVRAKRGEGVEGRFEIWKKNEIFEILLKNKPRALELVTPISGDCASSDLAISDEDRRTLIAEVQVVMHGAASVRFMEPLQQALNINTRSVRLMVQLAKEMLRLEAFVHVSTAYSNCVINNTQERFYPEHLTCPVDKVLDLSHSLSGELVDRMAPALLGKYPNTYTYTKALGEQIIQKEAGDLPIGVFRPAIILSSFKEPVPGWIDGLQGLVASIYGIAYGVIHLMLVNLKVNVHIIPVDYCANVAIASAVQIAKVAKKDRKIDPPIYTYSPTQSNPITYGELINNCYKYGLDAPNTKMVWYPFSHNITCSWLFDVGVYLYHMLPGFLIDVTLRLKGQKSVMIKSYHKIHEGIKLLYPFSNKSYIMDTKNTDQMWQSMSAEDKRIFNFDMSVIDWMEYFKYVMEGIRLYLFKDLRTPESIANGRKILFKYYVLDRVMKLVLLLVFGAFVWFLFNLGFN